MATRTLECIEVDNAWWLFVDIHNLMQSLDHLSQCI